MGLSLSAPSTLSDPTQPQISIHKYSKISSDTQRYPYVWISGYPYGRISDLQISKYPSLEIDFWSHSPQISIHKYSKISTDTQKISRYSDFQITRYLSLENDFWSHPTPNLQPQIFKNIIRYSKMSRYLDTFWCPYIQISKLRKWFLIPPTPKSPYTTFQWYPQIPNDIQYPQISKRKISLGFWQ